jgi:hypothetical protein
MGILIPSCSFHNVLNLTPSIKVRGISVEGLEKERVKAHSQSFSFGEKVMKRNGSISMYVIAGLVVVGCAVLLTFSSSLGLLGQQVVKDGNDLIQSNVSPEILEQGARNEYRIVEKMIRDEYVNTEIAKADLKVQEGMEQSLSDKLEKKVEAFNRGKEWLNSHTKEDEYVGQSGEAHSFAQVLESTSDLTNEIPVIQEQLVRMIASNQSLRDSITQRETLIAQKAIELDSARNRLESDVAQIEALESINKMQVTLNASTLDGVDISVCNAISERLARAQAEVRYNEGIGIAQESGNFLEEEKVATNLEAINEFKAGM